MAAIFKLICFLECSVTPTGYTFDKLLKRLYENKELRVYAVAIFKAACLLPYRATQQLTFFLDAIASQLRTKVNCDPQSKDSYEKLCLAVLGLGQLSKRGRELW